MRHIDKDKRYYSLQLKPKKKPNNNWGVFEMSKPCTDIDFVTRDRIEMCVKMRK